MEASYDTLNQVAEETSRPYVQRWHRLVSTTNWEKGRIVAEWRAALIEAGAPASEYSDDAWSRRLGGVSPQHTGRLRRVYARFGGVQTDYPGLYWSHFQAALDWEDAEMWLEGAVRNAWSVAEMRQQRALTLDVVGADETADPSDVSEEFDLDYEPEAGDEVPPTISAAHGVVAEAENWGEEQGADRQHGEPGGDDDEAYAEPLVETAAARPFARLVELPQDLNEAFESFKLAILRHKLAGWSEVSRDDVLGSLDALKQLALAPS
jgi:hypothetical protein